MLIRTNGPDGYRTGMPGPTRLFLQTIDLNGVPRGIRTPVAAVKGRCPRPLDDGDVLSGVHFDRVRWWSQAGSNRRPLQCHCSALPAELWPLHVKPEKSRHGLRYGQATDSVHGRSDLRRPLPYICDCPIDALQRAIAADERQCYSDSR